MPTFPVLAPTAATQDVAARALGRAFVDDPMFVTTLRDPVRRVAALPLVFRAMARQTADHGLVDLEADGHGAALWIDGRRSEITVGQVVRYGYVRSGLAGGIGDMLRLQAVQADIARIHRRIMGDRPHAYLFALGVDPSRQGQGVGSALLRTGCARTDVLGMPAYLETNLPQNVRLYERHGFVVRHHQRKHGFETWFMEHPAP